MKNKEKKVKKRGKFKMVVLIILSIILFFNIIGSILHATYYKNKKENIKPYGEMIEVFDGKMHVYKMGNGKKTIVLLPGMGTALPSADFGPLMRKLSKDYTVVCVEYFGVGFSSETNRERTTENYVEEIREALSKANIKAPYMLMPHSISSVYSEYFASKYKDEVEAIISLDGTSTDYIGEDIPEFVKSLLNISKLQQSTGLTSILGNLTLNKKQALACGYTEKEIQDIITYAGFSMNNTLLKQMGNSTEYVKDTNKLEYPKDVPYFKIISSQTYNTKNAQIKLSPEEYQKRHLARVGAEKNYKVLEGTHFIYQNNVEEIYKIVKDFIK